jgi:hypothetical protein
MRMISSVFLMVIIIIFFYFYHAPIKNDPPKIAHNIYPIKQNINKIIKDEFLLLMDQGKSQALPQILELFDLKLLMPLGEWAYVAKKNIAQKHEVIALNSFAGRQNQQLQAALQAHPDIHTAALNYLESDNSCARARVETPVIPRDPLYNFQWHLGEKDGIDMPSAWRITKGNERTVIAVVDRNFVLKGEDLTPDRCDTRRFYFENILKQFPDHELAGFHDDSLHGTDVLSVLAPCTNNNLGLAGINWSAQVFAVDTRADRSLAARMFGVMWAAGIDVCTSSLFACSKDTHFQPNNHPASLINASFGFSGPYLEEPPYGPVLDIIGWINRDNKILVASVGNDSGFADRRLPGAAGGVISVGSSTKEHKSASFSNFGRSVDILAPGEDILGLEKNSTVMLSGTSFSSPLVTGVVSLMLDVEPKLSWKQAEYILKKTASPMSCAEYCPSSMAQNSQLLCEKTCCQGSKTLCAAGILDAGKAVKMAREKFLPTALVDVDDYYVPLSEHKNMRGKLIVKNWGNKAAFIRMKPGHSQLKITPPFFELQALGSREIEVYFEGKALSELVLSLILEAANKDQPDKFIDQIEAIVEIIPDKIVAKKQYLELY